MPRREMAGREPSVAVCLSGELRTFDDPCTLRTVIDRIILPLTADVFACVSVPSHRSASEHARVACCTACCWRQSIGRSSHSTPPDCPDAEGCHTHGYNALPGCKALQGGWPQSLGLKCCADHALARRYDWIIRSRLDLVIPFVLRRLPRRLAFPAPRGVAIVA
eukprot:7383680-Prymnesium_polylepis.1